MRTTDKSRPMWDVLRPASIGVFVVIVVAWIVVALGPDWDSVPLRATARLAGYGAFIAMIVPYLHILRRRRRYRLGGPMTSWLRWHIIAAYVAFALVLIHSRGRANSPLTLALVWLTWIVMVSGVVGFYGQKLLYFLLPRVVQQEFGLERLAPQRDFVLEAGQELLKKKDLQAAPEIVKSFCGAAVETCLAQPLSFRAWFVEKRGDAGALSDNWYQRTLSYADAKQQELVRDMWALVQARRALDLEYRLQQLGRLWLLVHGPAAWALLVLMIEHAALSMWYGGF